jgi:hypothetical protein
MARRQSTKSLKSKTTRRAPLEQAVDTQETLGEVDLQ